MILRAFDSETHLIRPGCLTPRVVCGSWADGAATKIGLREEALNELEAMLDAREVEICGANIVYDFGCAAAMRPHLLAAIFRAYDEGRVYDISIAEALLDIYEGMLFKDPATGQPFHRYSQGMLETRYLGIDRSEQKYGENIWRLRYGELDGVPLEEWPVEALTYPLDDARYCREVAVKQKAKEHNLDQMAEQSRAAWALHLAAIWGIRTDPVTVASVVAEVEKGHTEAVARFAATGLFRPDGTKDSVKLARMVAEAYGAKGTCGECHGSGKVPSVKTQKPVNCKSCGATGLDIQGVPLSDSGERIKCDRDTLQESGDDELEAFAAIGMNEKWRSTYLPVLQQGTVLPINPEVNVLVATGRHSMRNPNLLNQPRQGRVRECYVPRRGSLFISCDYGTIELCTLAQVCLWLVGYSAMAEAINEGKDLHDLFAAKVRRISYDEQHDARKAGDKTAKDFRQMNKAFNFGYPGGLGAEKMVGYARQSYNARICELSGAAEKCGVEKVVGARTGKPVCVKCLEVAKELREIWFDTWPEVAEYHTLISSMTDGPLGGLVQVPGPGEHWGVVRGQCGFCDGSNLGFQGLAARGAKDALYRVAKESYLAEPGDALYGVRTNIFVYDEIIAEAPIATTHEAAHRISDIMVEAMHYYVPDVKVTAPPAAMAAWFKGADPVYENGRLVPWEPKPKEAKK